MRDELLRKYFLLPTSDVPLYIPPEGVDFEDEILEQVIARHKICNLQKSEDLFKVEEVQLSKEHIEECDREMKLMTVVDEE
ncbi:hypothetical protein HK098_000996 [Nowakowskiella sp. JEL0407]|nr:hypothetical protein HK098_000996 [Nowakowskiella sp. JEL0407]